MTVSEIQQMHEVPTDLDRWPAQELTILVLRRLTYFRRIALRRLGSVADAEDAVQDAFLHAYTHLGQFKGEARMSTWLTTIVINSVRMKLRSRPRSLYIPLDSRDRQNVRRLDETLPDSRPTPEEAFRREEFKGCLIQLLTRLSPSLRRAFQLHALEGLSIRETARRLGIRAGAVKVRVSRARARLRYLASAS